MSERNVAEAWNNLTIRNRFIFAKVMQESENCLPLLQMLFPNLNISEIALIEPEKTVEGTVYSKGIRYDVYVKDNEQRAFTLEMQLEDTGNLPLRSRYYAAMMDEDILQKGDTYESLKPTYIVFICPFDLFKKGLHRYTFRNVCLEDGKLELGDEATKIFLNTKGTKDDVPKELKAFLEYVNGIYQGGVAYVDRIEKAVQMARIDPNWRREYMNYIDEMKHERYLGRKEGHAEGFEAGREEERINTERERANVEHERKLREAAEQQVRELRAQLKTLQEG